MTLLIQNRIQQILIVVVEIKEKLFFCKLQHFLLVQLPHVVNIPEVLKNLVKLRLLQNASLHNSQHLGVRAKLVEVLRSAPKDHRGPSETIVLLELIAKSRRVNQTKRYAISKTQKSSPEAKPEDVLELKRLRMDLRRLNQQK